jgi:protein-tyrosine-phosphatase
MLGSMVTTPVLGPPAFLQLAGHPIRWRLLAELGRTDRRVHELTRLLGEPQNLVSYHLGKLRRAGLVTSRRSSADGRDAYYALDLTRVAESLSGLGGALHPALALDRPDVGSVPRARILFLCTGNSARSQIAEALTSERSGARVVARSAGSQPKALHPNAVRVLQEEYGIDIRDRRSKHIEELGDQRFDRVVTLCDRVREVCPELPGRPLPAHWSLPDPARGQGDDDATYPAFRTVAAELDRRITFLLADLAAPSEPIPA